MASATAVSSLVFLVVIQLALGARQYPQHPDLVTQVPFQDCGSEFGSLFGLSTDPPCGPTNCTFKRGENITLYADILPKINTQELRVRVEQIDPNFGFSTQLFPEFSACGRFNVTCPTEIGKPLYSVTVGNFPTSAPPLTINLKISLLTGDYKTLVCGSAKMILT